MSDDSLPYNLRYIQAWTILSILVGLILLSMFLFGNTFLYTGHRVWDLLRWLCSGII